MHKSDQILEQPLPAAVTLQYGAATGGTHNPYTCRDRGAGPLDGAGLSC